MEPIDTLLTTTEAANLLHLTPMTLKKWRRLGKGPAASRLGHRTVRYSRATIMEWAKGQEAGN